MNPLALHALLRAGYYTAIICLGVAIALALARLTPPWPSGPNCPAHRAGRGPLVMGHPVCVAKRDNTSKLGRVVP